MLGVATSRLKSSSVGQTPVVTEVVPVDGGADKKEKKKVVSQKKTNESI